MIRIVVTVAIAALITTVATAQTVTSTDLGSFVRRPDGRVIGSLRAVQGNDAIVWDGFEKTPGNPSVPVPAKRITWVHGLRPGEAPGEMVASR